MDYADLIDVPVEVFGGYTPAIPPSDLATGASPFCPDVAFPQGGVRTRGGLLNPYAASPIPVNANVNGLKSYLTSALAQRLMAFDSFNNLYKENPQGTLNLIAALGTYNNLFYQSVTYFGREYMTFFNNSGGIDLPRQFDDTFLDRISQVGPGVSPTAADAGAAGNVAAGLHQVACAFITRQSYITKASPNPSSWNAAGLKKVTVSAIPIGPPGTTGRLLLFTAVIPSPAITGSFFSLPTGNPQVATSTMLINDNVTTTVTVDFTDAILIAGFSANYLFSQLELGESAFITGYNSRLVSLGGRNKLYNPVNLTFQGGFSIGTGTGGSDVPLGWTSDPADGAGGTQDLVNFIPGAPAVAYRITGNGAAVNRGKITQTAVQDYLGVSIINPNTSYTVRVRALKGGGLAQGNLAIEIFSPGSGNLGLFTVPFANLTAVFAEFSGTLVPSLNTVPADAVFRIYGNGTMTNGGFITVTNVEIFPSNTPYSYSQARVSHALNPESVDATTGQIQVRPNDGQQLRAAFPLRNNLYLGKDHYLAYATDDGVNEPATWPLQEVSSTIGIAGPNAVDGVEEWFVFAHRSGLYICWGADPVKITPEIQFDASNTGKYVWNSINWAAGYTIWVRIDRVNKFVLVGVPINGALTPNLIFMMDYRWLETAQAIADSPLVTYSAFTGKILAHGKGRRWSFWNITANSMCYAERTDGTAQPFFGNGTRNGKVYQQLDNQLSDDGVAINSQYAMYFAPSHIEEMMMKLGSERKLLGTIKFRAIGAGALLLQIQAANRVTFLRSYSLSTVPPADGGRPVNLHGERFSAQVGTDAPGAWFQLEKFIYKIKKDAAIPTRGLDV